MKKEDARFFAYLGIVVAVVIIVAFFLTIGEPDLSFGRSVFYGLIKGNESVKKLIDWDSFKAIGQDLGANYSKLPSAREKEWYKKSFIINCSLGFQSVKGLPGSFINWRLRRSDNQTAVVATDTVGGSTLLLTISKKDKKRKLISIDWEKK